MLAVLYPAHLLASGARQDAYPVTNTDTGTAEATATDNATTVAATAVPTLTTLVSFNYTNGSGPRCGLIADAAGDLFGTTETGGVYGQGTVFEITKTGGSYASTPATLVSFNGANGQYPIARLIADAAGDLFGATGSRAQLLDLRRLLRPTCYKHSIV